MRCPAVELTQVLNHSEATQPIEPDNCNLISEGAMLSTTRREETQQNNYVQRQSKEWLLHLSLTDKGSVQLFLSRALANLLGATSHVILQLVASYAYYLEATCKCTGYHDLNKSENKIKEGGIEIERK
jgi:hypothetical protein